MNKRIEKLKEKKTLERDDQANEIKRLTEQLELAELQLKQARAAKFKLSIGKQKSQKGGRFCRVIIPDSHGSGIDKKAASAFLNDLKTIDPSEIIMLGDHIDCGGFLAQHHTVGYIAQSEYDFESDVIAANQFIDAIQERSSAPIDYIEGNHERRIENWITTQVVKNTKDANYLKSLFSVAVVLHLESRGVRLIEQGKFYDGVELPSTIKKGHCYFTHGSSTARHAASVHVAKFGGNVVYGHTHRADSYQIKTVKSGAIGAWSPGCLCKLQPLWQHTNPTDWSHGYGLQMVLSNGDFLHINVPIVKGKSLLNPLIEELK